MKIVYKKWFLFSFGIFVGFVIGISINWWKSPSNLSFNKLKHYLSSFFREDSALVVDYKSITNEKEKKYASRKGFHNKNQLINKNSNTRLFDSINNNNEIIVYAERDSTNRDTSLSEKNGFSNINSPINLIGDQLVSERTIFFKDITSINNSKSKFIDSLLIDDFNQNSKNEGLYKIEFWKSPVNYKGYKLGKNKIVLFGIAINEAKFLSLDDNIYLHCANQYYRLDKSSEFKPFIAVVNKSIIAQLSARKNEN